MEKKKSRSPIRELKVSLSKDGRYFLLRDSTVWVVPRNYISAIDKNGSFAKVPKVSGSVPSAIENVGEGNDRSN